MSSTRRLLTRARDCSARSMCRTTQDLSSPSQPLTTPFLNLRKRRRKLSTLNNSRCKILLSLKTPSRSSSSKQTLRPSPRTSRASVPKTLSTRSSATTARPSTRSSTSSPSTKSKSKSPATSRLSGKLKSKPHLRSEAPSSSRTTNRSQTTAWRWSTRAMNQLTTQTSSSKSSMRQHTRHRHRSLCRLLPRSLSKNLHRLSLPTRAQLNQLNSATSPRTLRISSTR